MALVNRSLMLDITPGAIPQVVKVSEYDENRAYTVTLIDEGGVFEIPSGTTATVEGSIGGNAFSESATVSGNTITFTLTESMTALAGDVWTKIKLTKDGKPVQTCAFILRCDKAGVEADTIINAPGFEEQINQGVADYLDDHQPFFTLPEGGEEGQALVSDGNGGAEWGNPPSSGSGLTEEVKQALLDCFANVAWANTSGASCYEALAEAFDAEPVIPGVLPSGFTKYDYIESTVASDRANAPTGGLIELKYYADLNQYGADFYFGFTTGVRSGGGPIFGGRPRSEQKTQSYAFYCNGSSLAMHGHGTDTGFQQPISTTPNTKHHCVYTNTAQSPSEYVVDDNQPYSFAWSNELTIPSKLYVNSNLGLFKGTQCGEIKLKNLDGTIADRYIPCVRDSDNVIGMYEVIHDVFYTASSAQYATIGNANCLYMVGNWG